MGKTTIAVRIAPEAMEHLRDFLQSVAGQFLEAMRDERREPAAAKAAAPLRLPARAAGAVEPAFLSRKDAGTYLGYSKSTIDRYVAQGLIKATGLHGERIARFELDRFMAETAKRRQPANNQKAVSEEDEIKAEAARLLDE
jgi:hypothetical protein